MASFTSKMASQATGSSFQKQQQLPQPSFELSSTSQQFEPSSLESDELTKNCDGVISLSGLRLGGQAGAFVSVLPGLGIRC